MSVPLLKYWDGQPVTYVCRKRSDQPVSGDGVFWSVGFEIVDEDATKDLKDRGGEVHALVEEGSGVSGAEAVPEMDESGDVD